MPPAPASRRQHPSTSGYLATARTAAGRAAVGALPGHPHSYRCPNRAGNWVSSGYNAGSTAGAALSGQLIGRIPLAACLPVLAAPVLLTVVPLLTLTRARPARAAPR